MNRRQLLRSAVALPSVGAALSVAAEQQKQLRITGVETDLLKPPPGEPTYDALLNVGKGSVVLRIRTDASITGWASSSFGNRGEKETNARGQRNLRAKARLVTGYPIARLGQLVSSASAREHSE